MKSDPAYVYLLHFVDAEGKTARYQHAGHYIGSAPPTDEGLEVRLNQHRHSNGAKLTSVIRMSGLDFVVSRTWLATRGFERTLKQRGGAARICPRCIEEARVASST